MYNRSVQTIVVIGTNVYSDVRAQPSRIAVQSKEDVLDISYENI